MIRGAHILSRTEPPAVALRLHPVEDDMPVITVRPGYVVIKTIAEWLMALVLIMLSAPLVLVLALAIKVHSPGPALYFQTRLGRNGKTYRLIKLRTMVHNAEAHTGPVWAGRNDCRITRLGKLLRDTHLDELPQLWNVLAGHMSLIGPRPERPEIASRIERELPVYRNRLLVRPGITGLAQMIVPADDPEDPKLRSVRRKLAHDLYYIGRMGFFMDLRITFSTGFCFMASALESLQKSYVRSYGNATQVQMTAVLPEEDCIRPAMLGGPETIRAASGSGAMCVSNK